MNKIFVKDLENYFDQSITIDGFVDNIRDLQYVQFLILRDSTGKLQITIEKNNTNSVLNEIVSNLTMESTIKVEGKLLKSEKVKLGGKELIPSNIIVTSTSLPELPIDLKDKDKSLRETRLDYRFLDLRREENNLFFKCETLFEQAMREYWTSNEYIEIHSPKISGASAESGAEVFKLDYFGEKACLSQSPQFYKQMAMAAGFDKVFEIGPAFRAENSHTSYHATEINMADVEVSWIDSVEDVMDEEENMLRYVFNKLRDTYGDKIKEVFGVEISDPTNAFPRVTFVEAKRILKEEFKYVGEKEEDFERKEEELMCQYAKDKYNSDFIFITKFPFSARPFYHMLDEDGLTNSYDLLFKGLEITTGAQREHHYGILKQQVIEKGINPDTLDFYLDFFKYGCPPHGGFAIGLARVMMQMFEIDNIREATFVYRGPTRLTP
ncbi:MAG: aspartate--tRNA(Asn) ligase [Bacilli bacterium]|nr:aspartate--tRNA(Asn) ligase [Bacilli bacterium]MDD4411690.1 aspartate--tRNA(Asn) ligase [Bacilli bacterium]